MDLDKLLGTVDNAKNTLGDAAIKFVRAEDRFVRAFAKYDNYLAKLNKELDETADKLKNIPSNGTVPPQTLERIYVSRLNEVITVRTEYLKIAYDMTYNDLMCSYDKILNISDADLDAFAQTICARPDTARARTEALNSVGALSATKLRYLLDPTSLK